MKTKQKLPIILLLYALITIQSTYAQDIQFSQFYASSTYLNPGLAGTKQVGRLMSHSRVQWPNLQANYVSTLLSYDAAIPQYNSAYGVVLLHDRQGQATHTSNEIKFQYAYVFNIAPKLVISSGIEVGYIERRLDNDFIYPDQYDDLTGTFSGFTDDFVSSIPISGTDIGTGMVIYSPKFWFGFSANHINRPLQSFLKNRENALPSRFVAATGYRFNLKGHAHYWLSPTLQYKAQGKSDQFEMGVHVLLDHVMFGGWYRGIPFKTYNDLHNNESIILMAGYKFMQHFQLSYSYDVVVSGLALISAGAHELNITYTRSLLDKHQKSLRSVICPPKSAKF